MRALRRKKHEPGLAEERRNLVHRYMGDETPPPATEELQGGELVEEVVVPLPLPVAADVVAIDVETPPVSSSTPRAGVVSDEAQPRAAEGLRADVAVEEVSIPLAAVTDVVANDVETPPGPEPRAGVEVETPRAVAPEPPAPQPAPAPPIAAADLLETLRPSAVGAALRTLEEVARLCEQLARLGEEHGRWNALLAEKQRRLIPPRGSPGP